MRSPWPVRWEPDLGHPANNVTTGRRRPLAMPPECYTLDPNRPEPHHLAIFHPKSHDTGSAELTRRRRKTRSPTSTGLPCRNGAATLPQRESGEALFLLGIHQPRCARADADALARPRRLQPRDCRPRGPLRKANLAQFWHSWVCQKIGSCNSLVFKDLQEPMRGRGEGGIRTLGALSCTRDFQSRTLSRSATSP